MAITLDGLLTMTKQMHASFALGSRKKTLCFPPIYLSTREKITHKPHGILRTIKFAKTSRIHFETTLID